MESHVRLSEVAPPASRSKGDPELHERAALHHGEESLLQNSEQDRALQHAGTRRNIRVTPERVLDRRGAAVAKQRISYWSNAGPAKMGDSPEAARSACRESLAQVGSRCPHSETSGSKRGEEEHKVDEPAGVRRSSSATHSRSSAEAAQAHLRIVLFIVPPKIPRRHREAWRQVSAWRGATPAVSKGSSAFIASLCISSASMKSGGKV